MSDTPESNDTTQFVAVRLSQASLYFSTELYYKNAHGEYLLYKSAGKTIPEVHTQHAHHPNLYINSQDRVSAITELQETFSAHLKDIIGGDNPQEIKETLVKLVDETLREPRAGVLKILPGTISMVVEQFSTNRDVMRSLMYLSDSDYTTAIHAVNVMALTISYCDYTNLSTDESSDLALMALLHDLGKTKIPASILKSPNSLSIEEFSVMKSHALLGAEMIYADPDIPDIIAIGALEHHEKLDGSGYPNGISQISFAGRILGIVDCYEALTGDERPYRRAKAPLATLQLLKEDVTSGKLDSEIFADFCRTLVQK